MKELGPGGGMCEAHPLDLPMLNHKFLWQNDRCLIFLWFFITIFEHYKGIFQGSFTLITFHSSSLFCLSNLLSASNFQMAAIEKLCKISTNHLVELYIHVSHIFLFFFRILGAP